MITDIYVDKSVGESITEETNTVHTVYNWFKGI